MENNEEKNMMKPSYDKVVPPSFLELGLGDLVSIYSELCELGKSPTVIDASELQENPEGMKSQRDEKMSDFVFCKTRTVYTKIVRNFLERCKIWSKYFLYLDCSHTNL
ncbi:uncharacterized protein LOC114279093 isoform X2 [Camellia sinensis]|uniref:uncharacterized protein LOC114279093 isoform X2 n=1 Tax=Camellia sinensis TaxID=4442 RepID=UPI001036A113|nr:uncharacterized protein LOC114279093 isoform X2 [Camellia sinensis]